MNVRLAMPTDHQHTPEAIRERLARGPHKSYVRDWVYGGIDGTVTTFAIVSGVVGADLSSTVVVVLGLANLAGDGFSMAAANYSGTRTEQHEYEHFEAMERRHIEASPEGEKEEVRQIYRLKGFRDAELETVVEGITSDRDQWIRTMLLEEHGLPLEVRSPLRAAAATFAAFLVCGLVPIVPYLLQLPDPFRASAALTGAVFFAIGSAKSRVSVTSWWRSGIETLVIGAGAAGIAYGIGHALRGLATGDG